MKPSIVAAFDFDGTLTERDSLLPLLFYKEGWRAWLKLAWLIPVFVQFLYGKISRQQTKERILTSFFKGMSIEELKQLSVAYVNENLDQLLKPEAIQRLKWHQDQGHRCILVSASLEVYLIPWAKRHGFHDVIASQLELNASGQVTGRLLGLNCWGIEKKRRVLDLLGLKEQYELYVYGDSQGDQELLACADYPYYRTFH